MFVVGGESLIDLVAQPVDADRRVMFEAHAGGSPFNCAIALSKLGNATGFLCPVSTDMFGDMLIAPLSAAGTELLLPDRIAAPTTLAVATLDGRGKASYRFYRQADRAFTRDGLVAALPAALEVFQFGGFCSVVPEDAEIWLAVADAAAGRGALVTLDPNVRPTLVTDPDDYRRRLDGFFDRAHLIKLSDDDLIWLDGNKSIEQHAEVMLQRPHCALVVVTLGEQGARAFTSSAEGIASAYRPAVFGDTVGAGDTLMAGILTILSEWGALTPEALGALPSGKLDEMLRFGAVASGLNCAHKGCVPPTRAEVDAILVKG